MRRFIAAGICTLVVAASRSEAQASSRIVTVDLVRAKPGQLDRLLRYYELNWAAARRTVLQQGGISGYRLLVRADTTQGWDVVLETEYPDPATFERREATFAPVLKAKGKILVDGMDRPALGDIVEARTMTLVTR